MTDAMDLERALDSLFESPTLPMEVLERRAAELLTGLDAIVWEGDAETFQFTYVGGAAARILGYPVSRWTTEPGFWADRIIHPDDRDHAVAYCALATGKRRDHDFQYRARAVDGRTVWLRDVVHVILGPRGVPLRLRGIMIDISDARRAAGTFEAPPRPGDARPMHAELLANAG